MKSQDECLRADSALRWGTARLAGGLRLNQAANGAPNQPRAARFRMSELVQFFHSPSLIPNPLS